MDSFKYDEKLEFVNYYVDNVLNDLRGTLTKERMEIIKNNSRKGIVYLLDNNKLMITPNQYPTDDLLYSKFVETFTQLTNKEELQKFIKIMGYHDLKPIYEWYFNDRIDNTKKDLKLKLLNKYECYKQQIRNHPEKYQKK